MMAPSNNPAFIAPLSNSADIPHYLQGFRNLTAPANGLGALRSLPSAGDSPPSGTGRDPSLPPSPSSANATLDRCAPAPDRRFSGPLRAESRSARRSTARTAFYRRPSEGFLPTLWPAEARAVARRSRGNLARGQVNFIDALRRRAFSTMAGVALVARVLVAQSCIASFELDLRTARRAASHENCLLRLPRLDDPHAAFLSPSSRQVAAVLSPSPIRSACSTLHRTMLSMPPSGT